MIVGYVAKNKTENVPIRDSNYRSKKKKQLAMAN